MGIDTAVQDGVGRWSIDELTYTRDEAAEFCQLVRKGLGSPQLTRVFILRSLVGMRKAGRLAGSKT